MLRVVSLVPSVTATVAELGVAAALIGVTSYCEVGAPPAARVVGGTKNPDVDAIVGLGPDLVLANTEENRAEDLQALRQAGLDVREHFPRAVDDVAPLLAELGELLGAHDGAAARIAALEDASADAERRRPRTPVATCTLIWRRPWMGLGPDTYADDLLRRCGFANVLVGFDERYPRLDPALHLRPELVLLPSEPYAFTDGDVPAVHDLLGAVPHRLVDGRLLTWHGTMTERALRVFSDIARDAAAA